MEKKESLAGEMGEMAERGEKTVLFGSLYKNLRAQFSLEAGREGCEGGLSGAWAGGDEKTVLKEQ